MRSTSLAIVGVLLAVLGCSTAPPPRTPGMEALRVEMTTAELRLQVYRFESYFAAVVQTAADEIAAAETDPSIREAAVRWKINSIPAMQAAVFQLDPLAALADAWGLCAQMERFFATGAGKDLFGDSQRIAVRDSLTLSEEAAALARSVVGVDGIKDVRPKLEAWLDENPIHDLSFGRRSVGADASAITAAEWGSGGLRSVGQIEDLVRDLSDRLTIYGEQIPQLARWHAELLAMEVNQNMLEPLWEDIASIERSAASLDAEIKELRRFVETTPHLVATERALILEAFEREIDSALADVHRQRVATIAALSSERKAILAEVDRLRSAVTDDLKQARVDGITDLELLVERRAQAFVDEAEGLVDVVFWRALTLLALALVGLAIVLRWTRSSAES